MKILLDTHIFLWAIAEPDRLGERWRLELESPANLVYLSAVSVVELMIKASLGKLEVNFNPVEIAMKSGFELLPFTEEDALPLKELPFHHRDPFDRMLIAQGTRNRLFLMTDDAKFRLYDCRLLR